MGRPLRDTGARVAVVGAGVSGLTCAQHLRRAGYRRVTVLERDSRVGGKCCSIDVGGRSYELGAVLGTRSYTATFELTGQGEDALMRASAAHCYDLTGRSTPLIPWYRYPDILRLLLLNYACLTQGHYRRVGKPGHVGDHPDLYEPFGRFAARHGIAPLSSAMAPPFTAFGYGSLQEVPAAYVLKYLDLPTLDALRRPQHSVVWPDGIERLLTRTAQQYDVRTDSAVCGVQRGEVVTVETASDRLTFDALILTCPFDEALGFLDATPDEQRLFTAIEHDDYWVLLCDTAGLPDGSGYLPANFDRHGHVMLWYRRWPADPLCTLYVLGDFAKTQEQIEATCAADLERMGARLHRVVQVRRWKYFPHVGPEAMAAGWYHEVESMQGANRTYYAGEIMSFATVELCARYARSLIQRYFA